MMAEGCGWGDIGIRPSSASSGCGEVQRACGDQPVRAGSPAEMDQGRLEQSHRSITGAWDGWELARRENVGDGSGAAAMRSALQQIRAWGRSGCVQVIRGY
jgi:hypothetical protein